MNKIAMFILVMFVVGCSTPQHSWPGNSRDMVWSAMVAAANTPDYDSNDPRKRWILVENAVDANAKKSQIIINRKLTRSLKLPLQNEQKETRDWLFKIQLLPNNPPTATFDTVYKTLIPARTIDEADRYFDLVDLLLEKPTN